MRLSEWSNSCQRGLSLNGGGGCLKKKKLGILEVCCWLVLDLLSVIYTYSFVSFCLFAYFLFVCLFKSAWLWSASFSSFARIFGECSTINSPPALFSFFLKWKLARAHYFHTSCQDQSTVAQRAETTSSRCSLTSCVWARSFPDRFPHSAWTAA